MLNLTYFYFKIKIKWYPVPGPWSLYIPSDLAGFSGTKAHPMLTQGDS